MTPEQQMIKELMENQSVMLDAIKDLKTENTEIKNQLAGKKPEQNEKKKNQPAEGEATEAELDEVFRNIRI